MTAQGIYLNVSRRNDDLPQLIEEYSEQFNLSKADTVAEILRANPKLITFCSVWRSFLQRPGLPLIPIGLLHQDRFLINKNSFLED